MTNPHIRRRAVGSVLAALFALSSTAIATSARAATLAFDGSTRLTGYTEGSVSVTYAYDGLGNLVKRCVHAVCKDIVVDDNEAFHSVVGESGGGTNRTYLEGPTGLAATGGITAELPLAGSLGTVHGYASTAGAVVGRSERNAFGAERAGFGSGQNIGQHGELSGKEDGIAWLRARAYSPKEGRFLQRDSFEGFSERPASLNRYSFVEGNPTNNTDPSGHFVPFVAAALVGTMLGGLVLPFTVPAGRWYGEQSLDPCLRDRLHNDADYKKSFYDDSEDAFALGNGLISTAGALAGGLARPPAIPVPRRATGRPSKRGPVDVSGPFPELDGWPRDLLRGLDGQQGNCFRCAVAVNERLGGNPTAGMPKGDFGWKDLSRKIGANPRDFQHDLSLNDVVRNIQSLGPGERGVVGIHGTGNNAYYAHYVNVAGGKNGAFVADGTRNTVGYLNGGGHNLLTAPPYASGASKYGFVKVP